MPIIAAFTFGDATLTVLEFALMFLWIWIAVGVIFDVLRSSDLSNWSKALWVLCLIVFPYIGVFVYLIVRGHTMHEHTAHDQLAVVHNRPVPVGDGTADSIAMLARLRDREFLTDEEFARAKAKVLG